MPIEVVIADDHAIVRAGLRLVLEAEPDRGRATRHSERPGSGGAPSDSRQGARYRPATFCRGHQSGSDAACDAGDSRVSGAAELARSRRSDGSAGGAVASRPELSMAARWEAHGGL